MLGVPPSAFTVGWVGRISAEKGLDVLLDALPSLSDIPVHLAVVGDGPLRVELEALARGAALTDRITWAGIVPDAGTLLRAFDVVVLSSRTEGTPIILLEAMAAGVPVVATAVGGVPDVVTGAEALLVDAENPVALASAIRAIVADRSAAEARAARARGRLVAEFALEPWLLAYERIYRSLLTPSRRCAK